MKSVFLNAIIKQANHAVASHQSWHFHILSPDCRLNTKRKFALILENTDTHETLVHYSPKPLMDTGKHLVQLLHGPDIVPQKTQTLTPPSTTIQPILTKAKQLSKAGQYWHHHLFFPDCQYNPHPVKWTLVLEDNKSKTVLENVYDTEPKGDLKHLEALFYQQKT